MLLNKFRRIPDDSKLEGKHIDRIVEQRYFMCIYIFSFSFSFRALRLSTGCLHTSICYTIAALYHHHVSKIEHRKSSQNTIQYMLMFGFECRQGLRN